MRILKLTDQRVLRAQVLGRLVGGQLPPNQAAEMLGLSLRQVRRLACASRLDCTSVLAHGNQGSRPVNKTADAITDRVKQLAGRSGAYKDFNVCHLHEKLIEEGLQIGRSTLDALVKKIGVRKARRGRPSVVHERRERMAETGAMLQIDGSTHRWLEKRSPSFCLIGAIDDATSRFIYGRFHPTECQEGYLLMLRTIAVSHGLPKSYYHDRHTILRSPKPVEDLEQGVAKPPMSQIQRILDQMDIQSIAAHSPQAKGRIERLWGTLQDRLLKEMRLAGINTLEEANAFLEGYIPKHNATFEKPAQSSASAWTPLEEGTDLNYYFAHVDERCVKPDHTIMYGAQTYALKTSVSLSGKRVTVHKVPEGDLIVYYGHLVVEAALVAPKQRAAAYKPVRQALAEHRATNQESLAKTPAQEGNTQLTFV